MTSTEYVLPQKETEDQNLTKAMEELEMWRNKVEKAETEKSRLLLEKLSTQETKKQVQNETMKLLEQQKHLEGTFKKTNQAKVFRIRDPNQGGRDITEEIMSAGWTTPTLTPPLDSILQLEKSNQALMQQLKKYEDMLKDKKAEYSSLQQMSKVKADIPETKVIFKGVETEGEDKNYQDIVGVFTITQKPSLQLLGGQALITFEEEKVAENILRLPRCSVTFDNNRMDLKPYNVMLDPSVKFELHMNVSKRKLRFSNLFPHLPEERMRDHLEIGFSKPSLGGGEVEEVAYNMDTGSGEITFLNTGVAESLALKKKYRLDANQELYVSVQPAFKYQLKKFQTYCGVSKRTVLLRGIEDVLDEEDLQDHLEIHFQKPSNYGGEVEIIKYISRPKTAEAYFSEDTT